MRASQILARTVPLLWWGATTLFCADHASARIQFDRETYGQDDTTSLRDKVHHLRQASLAFETDRFIVKFHSNSQQLEHATLTNAFSSHIAKTPGYASQLVHKYDDNRIFWGASFAVDTQGHHPNMVLSHLKGAPNVEQVWPDRSVRLMKHDYPAKTSGKPAKKEPKKESKKESKSKTNPHVFQVGHRLPNGPFNDTSYVHYGTGLAQQFAQGNLGKGVRVCHMDTGVDYSAPSLNGGLPPGTPCIGHGCQVVGGRDLIGDPFDGVHIKPKPLDYRDIQHDGCEHGTHTAGSVVSNNTVFPGAVPQGSLWHYKVFACNIIDPATGQIGRAGEAITYDSVILDGLSRGLKDKCDLFTSSIGGATGWDTEATAQAASNLGAHIPVFFSQGNSGDDGLFSGGSPASGLNVISVGAGSTPQEGAWTYQLEQAPHTKFGYYAGSPFFFDNTTDAVHPLFVVPGLEKDADDLYDGCDPDKVYSLQKQGKIPKSLQKSIVLLSYGGCSPYDKFEVYNNITGALTFLIVLRWLQPISFGGPSPEEPAQKAFIPTSEGLKLREEYIKHKGKLNLVFPRAKTFHVTDSPNPFGQTTFTSWGPSWNLQGKPQITAMGSMVLSTGVGTYGQVLMSGTSMSTPLAAGLAAMYKSVRRDADVKEIRAALAYNARPRKTVNTTALASVYREGSGWVDVSAMLASTTRPDPWEFHLRDLPRMKKVQELRLKNMGTLPQVYAFGYQSAQCVYGLHKGAPAKSEDTDEGFWMRIPEECEDDTVVTFSQRVLRVEPGQTGKISVHFHPGPSEPRLKMFSGWITVDSDDHNGGGRVPYTGIQGDIDAVGPFDTTFGLWNATLPALFTGDMTTEIRNSSTVFRINASDPYTWPVVPAVIATGSRSYICDLVKADLAFKATQPIHDDPSCCDNAFNETSLSSRTPHPASSPVHYTDWQDVPYALRIINSSLVVRDTTSNSHKRKSYSLTSCSLQYGSLPNGTLTYLQDGYYRVLLRMQKTTEEGNASSTYWSYLSHPFHVKVVHLPLIPPGAKAGPGRREEALTLDSGR
ncbi:unnamed protein product [Parajaminaea phylloscopi]